MSDVPDGTDPDPAPFDPTGLDLARRIADAARGGGPAPVPQQRRRRRPDASRREAPRDGRAEPTALGEALEDVIADRGWGTEVNVHLLLGRWAELVGPAVAEHSTPEAFRDGVVVVRTTSTNWATQLRLMAPRLLARMNETLGDGTVSVVRVIGPEAPSWRHGPRTVKGRGPRDTYG